MLRIAFPNKGRLAADAKLLFDDAGLDVRASSDRALIASVGGLFQAIFVRAQDIPEFVADGAADLGLTGWDLVVESGRDVVPLADLEFGHCRLVVAATDESGLVDATQIPCGTRVASAFPRLAQRFFADRGITVTIVPVSGAAEIAPHLGIADVIVDLVGTGSTLRVNGLHEVATVLESTARLIAPTREGARDDRTRADIEDLIAALESVVRARRSRYLMANVPRQRLPEIARVLPGLGGPTVVEIQNGGEHVAVHAVVAARDVYRTIGELRALAATGILVTRIERLLP